MNKLHLTIVAFSLAFSATALPTIQIDRVAQRWPWNNKVDITYTISGEGGQNVKQSQYCKVEFVATVGSETCTIDGARDVIAWADNGTHTVTWTNAPAGVRMSNCEMTAKLYRTDGYYMVVDLETGAYAFDDLADGDTPTATPTFSNARYNMPIYKTDRMVLRRIPRTSLADSSYSNGYATGDDTDYASTNGRTNWVTDADYFIGIFKVTRGQLAKLGLTDPSSGTAASGAVEAYCPVHNITPVSSSATSILKGYEYDNPGASDTLPCFFPRLNAKTGIIGATGLAGFVLPTEIMWEIACRAGATTAYPWGDTLDEVFTYCHGQTGTIAEAGKKASNAWGFYDMLDIVYEFCPGTYAVGNLKNASGPFTRAQSAEGGGFVKYRGCSAWANDKHPSVRPGQIAAWTQNKAMGFRAAIIMK